ncbi:MAG: hypothetical protein R2853_21075 [Thermomicrobiales bacterium]
MTSLKEARGQVLAEAIIQWEEQLRNPLMTARPSTIATGLARLHPCVGLTAGEIQAHLDHYTIIRQEYFAAYPDGALQRLWDSFADIRDLYEEARYHACAAGLGTGNIRARDAVVSVIEHGTSVTVEIADLGKGPQILTA